MPSSTTGTMTVTVQSSNLSSLAPKFLVYNSSLGLVNQASAINTFGATISTTASVTAGQSYYIKVLAAGGPGPIGAYGLLVNFGSQSQSPIPPPNTVVASQPDQGGGLVNDASPVNGQTNQGITWWNNGRTDAGMPAFSNGTLSGWTANLRAPAMTARSAGFAAVAQVANSASSTDTQVGLIGVVPNADNTTAPILASPGINLAPGQGNSVTVARGTVPSILQALDDVLASWTAQSTNEIDA